MANKRYDKEEGVWRTIGGRRVFIKTGQKLSDAMRESGKFKTKMNEEAVKGAREEDLKDQHKDSLNNVSKMEYNGEITRDEYDEAIKNINKEYKNRKVGDKFYTRKDGTKEYDPYKGTRFEKKYDSMEDVIKDPNSALNKYISEKEQEESKTKGIDWREQIKKNNEQMEKDLKDYTEKYDPFGRNVYKEDIKDNYYEIFRENERRNAKIKQEVPTEPYEFVEAYAGYRDKSYKLAGTKMSGKDIVEYGRNSWTGKEYTNDEFMEHLEDSNWHSERKQLLDANLTNQELEYIKNKTTLSQWSVGEELTGSANTQKLIDEAKAKFGSKEKGLTELYSGTVEYLKQTTNMSNAEILELLKKIEKDKK